MLHVGCEYGGSLAAFARSGFKVVGVETRLELARFSVLHLRAAGLEGTIHGDPRGLEKEGPGSFGVVVLSDIESLGVEAPRLEATARHLLASGGRWESVDW